MEAIRLPYDKVANTYQGASKAAKRMKAKDKKITDFDKSPDMSEFSQASSKEFVIIKRTFLTEEILQKSYLRAQTGRPMMNISNYITFFGTDPELTHFLINDCAGKIPVRLGKNILFEKPQSELHPKSDETNEELSEWCSDEEPPPKMRKLVTKTTMSQQNKRKCSREQSPKLKSSKKEFKTKKWKTRDRLKNHRKKKASSQTGT